MHQTHSSSFPRNEGVLWPPLWLVSEEVDLIQRVNAPLFWLNLNHLSFLIPVLFWHQYLLTLHLFFIYSKRPPFYTNRFPFIWWAVFYCLSVALIEVASSQAPYSSMYLILLLSTFLFFRPCLCHARANFPFHLPADRARNAPCQGKWCKASHLCCPVEHAQ